MPPASPSPTPPRSPERALVSRYAAAEHSTGRLLWQVTNSWQAAIRAALRPTGLTHVQFVLLASLAWLQADTPVTQRQLARFARTDEMMTSQVLRALEGRHLVERHQHPGDNRARALTVTADGLALANRANAIVEEADQQFFASLGKAGPRFTSLLARLADPQGGPQGQP